MENRLVFTEIEVNDGSNSTKVLVMDDKKNAELLIQNIMLEQTTIAHKNPNTPGPDEIKKSARKRLRKFIRELKQKEAESFK